MARGIDVGEYQFAAAWVLTGGDALPVAMCDGHVEVEHGGARVQSAEPVGIRRLKRRDTIRQTIELGVYGCARSLKLSDARVELRDLDVDEISSAGNEPKSCEAAKCEGDCFSHLIATMSHWPEESVPDCETI
jgi:prepilin-type processing-associated H-X9-DG protein